MALIALALDGHAEDICRALQEGEVMLDKLIVRLAVHLDTPKGLPSP